MDVRELREQPLAQTTPAGFVLDEVVVRLARADERVKWDALMDQHHYLGFKRFAGRGLRYVAEWSGEDNARSNGHYTDPHGKPKQLYVCALRRDARRILSYRGELDECWQARPEAVTGTDIDKRSLYEELEELPDHRRAQGRKHSIATVLAIYLLAALSNMRGPVAAGEYAQALSQAELKMLGGWWNRARQRYEAPTKSTIHRVVMEADSEALEAILQRYAKSRLSATGEQEPRSALAADGKRIRGANRNGTLRYETATLVEHSTGVPLASLNFHDRNGELAAVGALLDVTPPQRRLIPDQRRAAGRDQIRHVPGRRPPRAPVVDHDRQHRRQPAVLAQHAIVDQLLVQQTGVSQDAHRHAVLDCGLELHGSERAIPSRRDGRAGGDWRSWPAPA